MSAVRSEIQEIRKVMNKNVGQHYNRPQIQQLRPNASLPLRAPQNQIFNLPQPRFPNQNFNSFYRPPFQPRNNLNGNNNPASGNNQTNLNSY